MINVDLVPEDDVPARLVLQMVARWGQNGRNEKSGAVRGHNDHGQPNQVDHRHQGPRHCIACQDDCMENTETVEQDTWGSRPSMGL